MVRRPKPWNGLPGRIQDPSLLEGFKNRLKNYNRKLGQENGLDDFKRSLPSLLVNYSALFSSTHSWTVTTHEFDTCWQPRWRLTICLTPSLPPKQEITKKKHHFIPCAQGLLPLCNLRYILVLFCGMDF